MKNRQIILLGVTSIVAIGLVVILAGRSKKHRIMERLDKIAEEGYEFAEDILYPTAKPIFKNDEYSYYKNY
ncbi:MAG: hypothetical protein JWR18_255 [Segetibacter sp.]|jgi:hypothetical protein|nr:hypothetical protein [Segetibacter sp.]